MSLSAESSFTERIFQSLVFVFRLIIKIIMVVSSLYHPILLAGAPGRGRVKEKRKKRMLNLGVAVTVLREGDVEGKREMVESGGELGLWLAAWSRGAVPNLIRCILHL